MKKNLRNCLKYPAVMIIIIILLTIGFGSGSCSKITSSGPMPSIIVGLVSPGSWPFIVAEEKQYFSHNDLAINLQLYDSDNAAMAALIKGEVDIAYSGEYLMVIQAFSRQNLRIIGNLEKNFSTYLVAREDHNINHIPDLKGKLIGIPMQTLPEFYLGRFLELQGVHLDDVIVVNTNPVEASEALQNLDAVVTCQNYIPKIEQKFPGKTIFWQIQNNQASYNLLIANNDWINQNSDLVFRLLRALDQANSYLEQHVGESLTIIQKQTQIPEYQLARLLSNYEFDLSLDESLIAAMQDESRWMIDNKLTTAIDIPDFPDYIYTDGLQALKPEAVSIIR